MHYGEERQPFGVGLGANQRREEQEWRGNVGGVIVSPVEYRLFYAKLYLSWFWRRVENKGACLGLQVIP